VRVTLTVIVFAVLLLLLVSLISDDCDKRMAQSDFPKNVIDKARNRLQRATSDIDVMRRQLHNTEDDCRTLHTHCQLAMQDRDEISDAEHELTLRFIAARLLLDNLLKAKTSVTLELSDLRREAKIAESDNQAKLSHLSTLEAVVRKQQNELDELHAVNDRRRSELEFKKKHMQRTLETYQRRAADVSLQKEDLQLMESRYAKVSKAVAGTLDAIGH
jgi:chromosome segregation ATPase